MIRIFIFAALSIFLISCKPGASIVCADLDNQNVNEIYIGTKGVDCGLVSFNVEVALTQAQQMKGLMKDMDTPYNP